MKKVLLFFALIVGISVAEAQEPLSYEFVIQKDGVTAVQIYNQLVDWIATNFKAVDGDFYRDKDEQVITKDVMIEFSAGKLSLIHYDGNIRYKMKFQCRDGRFKVQMVNFEHSVSIGKNTSCSLGLILDKPQRLHNGSFDERAWEKIKETTDAEANRLRQQLESMTFDSKNDDW